MNLVPPTPTVMQRVSTSALSPAAGGELTVLANNCEQVSVFSPTTASAQPKPFNADNCECVREAESRLECTGGSVPVVNACRCDPAFESGSLPEDSRISSREIPPLDSPTCSASLGLARP